MLFITTIFAAALIVSIQEQVFPKAVLRVPIGLAVALLAAWPILSVSNGIWVLGATYGALLVLLAVDAVTGLRAVKRERIRGR